MAKPTPLERELLAVYRDAEHYLLAAATRAVKGVVKAPAKDEALRRAEGLRAVQAASASVVTALNSTAPATLVRAIRRAAKTGGMAAARELAAAAPRGPLADQAINLSAIDQLAATVVGRVVDANNSILRTVPDAYRQAIAAAVPANLVGVETRRDVSQRAWWALTQQGITGFTDRAGRRWRLSSYVEMAARTAINRAEIDGNHARLAASGQDLVMVIGSGDRCPKCRPWHAEILSISGQAGPVEVEHTLRDGEMLTVQVTPVEVARAAGWNHPNCRCGTKLWLPGVTKPDKLDKDDTGYKERQQQRALERHIRYAKERADAALSPEAEKQAKAEVRAGQARMRAHLDANPTLLRLTYREQIGAGNIPTAARRLELDAEQRPDLPDVDARADRLRAAGVDTSADTARGQAEAAAARAAEEQAARELATRDRAAATRAAAEKAEKLAQDQAERAAAEKAAADRAAAEQAARDEAAQIKREQRAAEEAARAAAEPMGMSPEDLAADYEAKVGDLDSDEGYALALYTGGDFVSINGWLRGNDLISPRDPKSVLAFARENADHMDRLVERYQLPETVTARRYLDRGALPDNLHPGDVFTDDGFVSTTLRADAPQQFAGKPVEMTIDVPEGSNAIIVNGAHRGIVDEQEMILQPGTRFTVTSDVIGEDGVRRVAVTSLPPDPAVKAAALEAERVATEKLAAEKAAKREARKAKKAADVAARKAAADTSPAPLTPAQIRELEASYDAAMAGASAAEREALQMYKSATGFMYMNGILRDQAMADGLPANVRERYEAWNELLAGYAARSPELAEPITVFRRVNAEALPEGELVGKTIEPRGWHSTSMSQHGASTFRAQPIVMKIAVPKGMKAIVVGGHEDELILPDGTRFVVQADEMRPDGKRWVTMQAIEGDPRPAPEATVGQADLLADYEARAKPASTVTERRAVNKYTGVNYRVINAYMRGQPLPEEAGDVDLDMVRDQIAAMNELAAKYVTPARATVRRYLNDGVIPTDAEPGTVITPKGFTSTSMGEDVPDGLVNRQTVMVIDVPKGTHAIIPDAIGVGIDGENELILPEGLGYRVDSIEVKDGKRWVKMTAIPPL